MFVKILPLMSPETCSSQMPLPPLPRRQWDVAALERDAGKAEAAGPFALQHRGAAVKDEFGRAAYADQLRAALQTKQSGAVDAWRQHQRHLRACGFVDRALQIPGLVVGTAGPRAILRDIAAERGGERCRARHRATRQARWRRRLRILRRDGGG
jgi:hypothetical protein